jgi:hypothetical protein
VTELDQVTGRCGRGVAIVRDHHGKGGLRDFLAGHHDGHRRIGEHEQMIEGHCSIEQEEAIGPVGLEKFSQTQSGFAV